MKWLLVLVPTVVVAAGCIDLEGAYQSCVSGGCLSADAGAGVDAGVDSGVDAGLDAGVDAGPEPYDGGPRCFSSARPRLRCGPEVTLSDTSTGAAVMSAVDGGFVVGWLDPTVQLRSVALDGSVTALGLDAGMATALALDARGDHWAAVWNSSGVVGCATREGNTLVSAPDGGLFSEASVAVDGQGRVFVNASTFGPLRLHSAEAAGCPTALQPVTMGYSRADGLAAVATASGFRNVWTYHSGSIGFTSVSGLKADAGFGERSTQNESTVDAISAVASTAGTRVFSATAGEGALTGHFEVVLTPADLSNDGTMLVVDGGQNTFGWNTGTCGPGCLATATFDDRTSTQAVVTFFSEAPFRQLSAWDAVCSLPSTNSTSLALAPAADGRLGVLATTPNSVKLYFCDVPPLD